jgi:hypothetical protein
VFSEKDLELVVEVEVEKWRDKDLAVVYKLMSSMIQSKLEGVRSFTCANNTIQKT